ncbi:hypothetical protein J7U46_22405 [Pelomonas sp. V22]|uniref:hypothetical protein n=1 Tax=Pelomonas sp. V22 TaxID=2822139 RepID=UPI0024A91D86|nr:hypothetical protein [Pelomonas sp. V22]MDI4635835.1 hypothetical protein [Pelomonas sp. V22]
MNAAVAAGAATSALPFGRCVFVNAPFDKDYLPILHAILFGIHDCGFVARIAVEDTGTNETRLDKIARIIGESRYSVHDICRVEITDESPLPRFNMPFEFGLAMGAIRYGSQPGRDSLLMTAELFQDKKTLSDVAGQDSKAHGGDPKKAIAAVRSFLSAKAPSGEKTRGGDAIWNRYQLFLGDLPVLAEKLEVTFDEIQSFDYLRDWINVMSQWILKRGARR